MPALLREEVLEEVGHTLWVFVMPKMLRLYLLHNRELLGKLARATWETVRDLMIEATGEETLGPGMVVVVQTAHRADKASALSFGSVLRSLGGKKTPIP